MFSKLLSSQIIIYNFILFFSFSLSVNYFVNMEFINYLAYVFFHLTLIYVVFYFFHISLVFVTFLYGIFFDIFLIDYISPHLISFLIFITIYFFTKKFLINFSSNKVSFIIIFLTLIMFVLEALISNLSVNYPINFNNLALLFMIATILFIPTLKVFSKIDKL